MDTGLDLNDVTNPWSALAFVGGVLIIVLFGWAMQRTSREAKRSDVTTEVGDLVTTVRLLSARVDALEKAQSEHSRYHEWLKKTMPRPPFITFEEWQADQ